MTQLDTYYRALTEYSKETKTSREIVALLDQIIDSSPIKEELLVRRAICIIDEEWVNEIEKGLEFIEKAIKEERQFILSNGEVIPIEKVKSVSRHSIEHLSRHSSLITRYDNKKDIVPDGLYTVEKLTDYTVYENKFLYMLLCYLRDFITIRYNAILDITNRYNGSLDVEKEIALPRRKLKYKFSLTEQKNDDEYLRTHNPAQKTIDKISLLLKSVIAYLATPLMQEVSKVAMIKPPIVKTNVLKMNNNFKNAVALYEYIVAYDGVGYKIEYKENLINNFHGNLASDIADTASLLSFVAYEYGLQLNDELKENYLSENERAKIEELEKREAQIKALKRKLANGQITPEEYILTVEKQIRSLENEKNKIVSLNDKVIELKEEVKNLKLECSQYRERIFALESEVNDIALRHKQLVAGLNNKHQGQLVSLKERYEEKIENVNREYNEKISNLISEYESKLTLMKVECENAIDALTREYEDRLYKINKENSQKLNGSDSVVLASESVGDNDIIDAKNDYSDKVDRVNEDYDNKVQSVSNDYEDMIVFENAKQDKKFKRLVKYYNDKIKNLTNQNNNEIDALNKAHLDETNALKQTIKDLKQKQDLSNQDLIEKVQELNGLLIKTTNINDELAKQINLAKGQILAVRAEYGISPDEKYDDANSFAKLDKQYKAFKEYYLKQFNAVKRNSKKGPTKKSQDKE